MVLINKAINEVTVKLVYYGPGLCGKTTNLEQIYKNPKLENKGKMISMATETDRTLFFDFMPMELGTIAGQKVRVQLYTVPGQVFYDATRKLVLRGADGVVFVADSQPSMRESNLESLENLRTNLRVNRIDPEKVAVVYQYNKRDLPGVSSVEEMNEYMQPGDIPVVEAAAVQGIGVAQTLRAAVGRILDNLKNNVDTTLYDAAPLQRPVMTAGSGATQASTGLKKVSIAALAAEKNTVRPMTRPGNVAAPSFVASPPQSPLAAPFLSSDEAVANLTDFDPLEADPVVEPVVEPVLDTLPEPDAETIAVAEAPAGYEAEDAPFISPLGSLHDAGDDVFGESDSPLPEASFAADASLLSAADDLVRQLETALDAARRHRDELAKRVR